MAGKIRTEVTAVVVNACESLTTEELAQVSGVLLGGEIFKDDTLAVFVNELLPTDVLILKEYLRRHTDVRGRLHTEPISP